MDLEKNRARHGGCLPERFTLPSPKRRPALDAQSQAPFLMVLVLPKYNTHTNAGLNSMLALLTHQFWRLIVDFLPQFVVLIRHIWLLNETIHPQCLMQPTRQF